MQHSEILVTVNQEDKKTVKSFMQKCAIACHKMNATLGENLLSVPVEMLSDVNKFLQQPSEEQLARVHHHFHSIFTPISSEKINEVCGLLQADAKKKNQKEKLKKLIDDKARLIKILKSAQRAVIKSLHMELHDLLLEHEIPVELALGLGESEVEILPPNYRIVQLFDGNLAIIDEDGVTYTVMFSKVGIEIKQQIVVQLAQGKKSEQAGP